MQDNLNWPVPFSSALLSLLLVMAVDSTRTVAASRNLQCGNFLQQTLKLTRLVQKESVDLIKTYVSAESDIKLLLLIQVIQCSTFKHNMHCCLFLSDHFILLCFLQKASQGELSELFCKVTLNEVPDPNISGLEPSERIVSISTHLQAFFPHFKRVYEQQTDLQLPTSPLLAELNTVNSRSKSLAALINGFYQSLFPNLPVPEPAGGPTTLPPPQNVFQQKVYGCVVLKTYKEFLSNVSKELRTLKNKVCRRIIQTNTLFLWGWPKAGLRQFVLIHT